MSQPVTVAANPIAQLRKEMGEAARAQAAEHTIEKMAHLWEGAMLP